MDLFVPVLPDDEKTGVGGFVMFLLKRLDLSVSKFDCVADAGFLL